jgi:hypothetical protein
MARTRRTTKASNVKTVDITLRLTIELDDQDKDDDHYYHLPAVEDAAATVKQLNSDMSEDFSGEEADRG